MGHLLEQNTRLFSRKGLSQQRLEVGAEEHLLDLHARVLLGVDHPTDLLGQGLLGESVFRTGEVQLHQGLDVWEGQEGELLEQVFYLAVGLVEQVLGQVVLGGETLFQPDGVALTLPELGAFGGGQQRHCHHIPSFLFLVELLDQLQTCSHVAPLVTPSDLDVALVVSAQDGEVVGLQGLVGELSEGQAALLRP